MLIFLGIAIVCACVFRSGPVTQVPALPEPAATTTGIAGHRVVGVSADKNSARKRPDPVAGLSPDATIDVIQKRLEPLARRRDLKASAALSRAAIRCYTTTQDITALQGRINTDTRDRDPRLKEARDRNLTAQIEAISDFRTTHCDMLSRETLDSLTRFAAKNAAALGDVDAQMCVIQLRFLETRRDASPDESLHGWDYIAAYSARAFERGDWRIVSLMRARTISRGHGPIFARDDMFPGDPVSYLRAVQLLRLGAGGEFADELDEEIAKFIETVNPAMIEEGIGLQATEISDAKVWAQAEFDSHFSGSPALTEPPTTCGDY